MNHPWVTSMSLLLIYFLKVATRAFRKALKTATRVCKSSSWWFWGWGPHGQLHACHAPMVWDRHLLSTLPSQAPSVTPLTDFANDIWSGGKQSPGPTIPLDWCSIMPSRVPTPMPLSCLKWSGYDLGRADSHVFAEWLREASAMS